MHKPYIKNKERYIGVRIDVQIYKYISTGLRWIAIENSSIPTLSINVQKAMSEERQRVLISSPSFDAATFRFRFRGTIPGGR